MFAKHWLSRLTGHISGQVSTHVYRPRDLSVDSKASHYILSIWNKDFVDKPTGATNPSCITSLEDCIKTCSATENLRCSHIPCPQLSTVKAQRSRMRVTPVLFGKRLWLSSRNKTYGLALRVHPPIRQLSLKSVSGQIACWLMYPGASPTCWAPCIIYGLGIATAARRPQGL